MTDREPVNIMGVIAFPNPDKDQRVIRFIDSEYHTLFTIKDGESIVITRFDGEKMVFPCKYIDDCHVCIGNSAYHICEFAEMQERNGNTYVPSAPKISGEIGTYEIYQIPATADVDYYFRSYEAAKGKLQSADYYHHHHLRHRGWLQRQIQGAVPCRCGGGQNRQRPAFFYHRCL